MASNFGFQWQVIIEGNTNYAAHCKRDALIIVSSESLQGPDIVPRRDVELTEEDVRKLERLDIPGPVEQWKDDATIMKARFELDTQYYDQVTVKRGETKRSILEACELLLKSSNKTGVDIFYFGPGKRNTGDWCFEDGYITFRDLAELYCSYFKGRMMDIESDCSYSGCWVKELMKFMEEQGVKPCGHSAQETGMMINCEASCRSYEIPYRLLFATRACNNDKNTGTLTGNGPRFRVAKHQQTISIFATELHCSVKSIEEPCTLLPAQTWQRLQEGQRLELVRTGYSWLYLLLEDDQEKIREFNERKGIPESLCFADYGKIIKSGEGEEPPNDVQEWIDKMYNF